MKTTKLQLTLKGHDAELLESATRIAAKTHPMKDKDDGEIRRWLAEWCIRAVCRAVVGSKVCPAPLAVQLRFEYIEETQARDLLNHAYRLFVPANASDDDQDEFQFVALAESLERKAIELRVLVDKRSWSEVFKAGMILGNRWN